MEMTSNYEKSRKLYKSRTNRMIDGVCGGIAEHFGLDPTIVRVVWVVFTLMGGAGFILYIAAMIIMPTNKDYAWNMPPSSTPGTPDSGTGTAGTFDPNYNPVRKVEHRRFWGIILILIGAMFLLANIVQGMDWFEGFDWFDLSWEVVFPVIMIAMGVWIVMRYIKRDTAPGAQTATAGPASSVNPDGTTNASWTDIPNGTQTTQEPKTLRRSRMERKLFGVCGGIAQYFGIDPNLVRVGYVLLVIASVGWGILLYVILAFLLPEEPYPMYR